MFLLGKNFYLIFISVWIIGLYFVLTNLHTGTNNDKVYEVRIEAMQVEIDRLAQRLSGRPADEQRMEDRPSLPCKELRDELKRVKRQLRTKQNAPGKSHDGPTLEYEMLRRNIERQTRELTYFTANQMDRIAEKLSADDQSVWKRVTGRFADQTRVLLASIRNLTQVDGHESWREREHESLSTLMQARLHALQNPSKPCADVKRVTCSINKGCGYGCEIHHAMHCFHIAYALGRPMILFSEGWRYNPSGFDKIFQPLSETCTTLDGAGAVNWGNYEKAGVVDIPLIDTIHPRKDFMPMAVPADIAARLTRLHGNPFAWFTGQLMKYLLRPQGWLQEFMDSKYQAIRFESPMIGVHVRRTDKVGTEAAFHDIAEYMRHVEDYYKIYQYQNPDKNVTRRVYLATDEPSVFADARAKFPKYIFLGDAAVAKSAQVGSRYGTESLKGVLLDIHFLSLCDYLVCTFSSQICRVAYEVMQQRVVDAAWRVQPLDDVYYFGGQNAHNQRAVIAHQAHWANEFSFERGDLIGTQGNHWDGFSKGSDKTRGQAGLYPSYKTEEIVNVAVMHTYPEVKIPANE